MWRFLWWPLTLMNPDTRRAERRHFRFERIMSEWEIVEPDQDDLEARAFGRWRPRWWAGEGE